MRTGRNAQILLTAGLVLAASGFSTSAEDFELPTRKAGLWEVKMAMPGQPGMPEMTTRLCTDADSDKDMMESGLTGEDDECTPPEIARDGDTTTIKTSCPTGPITVTINGDFESSYTMTIAAAEGPAMTQEARWLGESCGDGMAPGDMIMPGGVKMNFGDAMKMGGGG